MNMADPSVQARGEKRQTWESRGRSEENGVTCLLERLPLLALYGVDC